MTEVVSTVGDLKRAVADARVSGECVGFVPTMGALHEGHASLIRSVRQQTSRVVVSIFVNPTQFGPGEDLDRYPRDLDADLDVCRREHVSVVYVPGVQEMYPSGPLGAYVEIPGLMDRLEGAVRPGHFRGVATVVLKLLHQVEPDFAVFGQKDYQQCRVVKRMVRDLDLNIEIRIEPTVRDPDGLALSSRNIYLSPEAREAALVISRSLSKVETAARNGERVPDRLRQILKETLDSEPQVVVDYGVVVDAETLEEVERAGRPLVALVAARVGRTRLIDNVLLPG
jgi:pantoate--beta-alanine ligase